MLYDMNADNVEVFSIFCSELTVRNVTMKVFSHAGQRQVVLLKRTWTWLFICVYIYIYICYSSDFFSTQLKLKRISCFLKQSTYFDGN